MAWTRAALVPIAGAILVVAVSGGTSADPQTPSGLPGLPPPFLGTAVVGSGGLTAAVDAYGDVVDLRAPGPAGTGLIDNSAVRQAAGTVPAETGIVPRVDLGAGARLPLWRADAVAQHYRPGTNVLVTEARFGAARVAVTYAARGGLLACLTHSSGAATVSIRATEAGAKSRLRCNDRLACGIMRTVARSDRRWLSRARPLGDAAPRWARALYRRSLLVLRALADRETGAVAAGARDGWAYVWPRDAGAAALALAASGYREEARRVTRFLLALDLAGAARFHGDGTPVAGRDAQGDASGWASVAARASGLPAPTMAPGWRDLSDYQESARGDYLANAIADADSTAPFETPRGLVRVAADPGSGLDAVAAWAVRPFPRPSLFAAARRTLLRLTQGGTRFGIVPGEGWPGTDPWSAPTAWAAWSLAALGERPRALRLLADLRRAATPAGTLPERVDAHSGIPRSTTPLAWSHAFAILALRELWP